MAGCPAMLATRKHLSAKPDGSPVPSERHGPDRVIPKAEKRNPPAPRGALLPGASKSPSPSMQAPNRRSAWPVLVLPRGRNRIMAAPVKSRTRPPKRGVIGNSYCWRAHLQSRTGSPRFRKPATRLLHAAFCHDWQQQEGVVTGTPPPRREAAFKDLSPLTQGGS